jgi:predicted aspartyl protease
VILSVFHDRLARVTLDVKSIGQSYSIEFILDTGFDGEIALPSKVLSEY